MEAVQKFNLVKRLEIRLNRSEVTKYLASIDRRVPSPSPLLDVTIKAEPGAENEDDQMPIIIKTECFDIPDPEKVGAEVGVRGLHCPTCQLTFKYELHLKHHLTTNRRCALQDNRNYDITNNMSSISSSSNALPTSICPDVTVKAEKTDDELPIIIKTDSLDSSDPELTRSEKVKGFPCPTCQLTFKYRLHLTHHLITNNRCAVQWMTNQNNGVKEQRKRKYSCPVCKKELSRAFILRDHMAIHSDERPFVCSTCLRTFKLQEYLDRHTLIQHKFKCEICHLCFVKALSLKEHVAQSHPDGLTQVHNNFKIYSKKKHETETPVSRKKFSCPDCKKEFNYFYILRLHMRIHGKERSPFQSDMQKGVVHLKSHESVKKIFPSRARNKDFEMNLVRTNARPYVCSTCRHSFKGRSYLNRHTRKEHRHKCPDCELSFIQKVHVADHAIQYHRTEARIYFCPACKKKFKGISSLQTHMRVHAEEKPFVCSECQRAFIDKNSLTRHTLKTHLTKCDNCELVLDKLSLEMHVCLHHQKGIKNLSCDIEGKDNNGHSMTPAQPPPRLSCKCNVCKICFKSHSLLLHHQLRFHSKMKRKSRYQCDKCDKEFFSPKEWIMHLKSHGIDRRVFPCHECNKEFGVPSVLRRHMNTVHSKNRPFVCPTCMHTFKLWDALKSHSGKEHVFKCPNCELCFVKNRSLEDHASNYHQPI